MSVDFITTPSTLFELLRGFLSFPNVVSAELLFGQDYCLIGTIEYEPLERGKSFLLDFSAENVLQRTT